MILFPSLGHVSIILSERGVTTVNEDTEGGMASVPINQH